MSVLQAMEAVQTTVGTNQAPTAATAEIPLTWIQMEGTAPANQDSARMILCWLVLVSWGWDSDAIPYTHSLYIVLNGNAHKKLYFERETTCIQQKSYLFIFPILQLYRLSAK